MLVEIRESIVAKKQKELELKADKTQPFYNNGQTDFYSTGAYETPSHRTESCILFDSSIRHLSLSNRQFKKGPHTMLTHTQHFSNLP